MTLWSKAWTRIGTAVHAAAETVLWESVTRPLMAHVTERTDRLEIKMSASFDQALARFAQVQTDGFALVRQHVTKVVEDAKASGDTASAENAARLDAAVDSLSAGFSQFAAAVPAELPTESLPPVVNPDTPAPAETVSDVAAELPVDPQVVVDDPSVPTSDEGSAGGDVAPETEQA